jgi:hypothetical protein
MLEALKRTRGIVILGKHILGREMPYPKIVPFSRNISGSSRAWTSAIGTCPACDADALAGREEESCESLGGLSEKLSDGADIVYYRSLISFARKDR